jgi:2-keto-4-pentenoate hydratase/2-oxohepta-3-ene-1,7-dioic acid hydratase in catechol pathway
MTTNFGLATLSSPRPVAAIEVDDFYWALDDLRNAGLDVPALDVKTLLLDWFANFPKLTALAEACVADRRFQALRIPDEQRTLALPLQYPNKLFAVGANYSAHLAEMGLPAKRWDLLPFFLKPPTTSMVGPGKTVIAPPNSVQLDWEVELAVVVGRHLSHASREEAFEAIAGYSVAIDLGARDMMLPQNYPPKVDLIRGKCQDTMCPFGPLIRPAAFIADPHNLRLRLSVNGLPRQDGSTREMLFSIDEQLSTISEFITIEPGDVVITGSTAGSAAAHGNAFLKPGDHIRAEIEGIGALEVEVMPWVRKTWAMAHH